MNIGTISYATQSGLGHLAKQFYDNGVINRILITSHPRYKSFPDWYEPTDRYDRSNFKRFLEGLHALIIFENAFNNWGIVQMAKRAGCKFILSIMYEWTPKPLPVRPDMVWCPSLLDIEYAKDYPHEFVPIPVPRNLTWRKRERAIQFVHNGGHFQIKYAKGTPEVLEAFARHVKSGAKLLVRGQKNEPRVGELFSKYKGYDNITIQHDDIPYEQLFATGDVFINAERYNGLSLPLQEAYASGMLVMTSDRFPANSWLPTEPLIPVDKYTTDRVNQTDFQMAHIDPKKIAEKVDQWFGRDISEYSERGRQWGVDTGWDVMKPIYMNKIEKLVKG